MSQPTYTTTDSSEEASWSRIQKITAANPNTYYWKIKLSQFRPPRTLAQVQQQYFLSILF